MGAGGAPSPVVPNPAPAPVVPVVEERSSAASPPPAGWASAKAAEAPSPTSSIMKRKQSPGIGPSASNPLVFGAASAAVMVPPPSVGSSPAAMHEHMLKQQLMIEELARENRNLQGRVGRWLESTEQQLEDAVRAQQHALEQRRLVAAAVAGGPSAVAVDAAADATRDAGDTVDAATVITTLASDGSLLSGMLDERTSPSVLLARIRRLELALQLEAMERDDCETKLHVQQRMIAYLLRKLQ